MTFTRHGEEARESMKNEKQPVRLSLNGIPFSGPHDPSTGVAYELRPGGMWRSTKGDDLPRIDAKCADIRDAFEHKLFPDGESFAQHMQAISPALYWAGLNSESSMTANDFGAFLSKHRDYPDLFRLLYLFDCQKLVSGIQECSKEATILVGEFYRVLNLEELNPFGTLGRNEITFVTSPKVTQLHCTLAMVYVRLHSLLDYTTKLAVEVEKTRADFRTYPKMVSASVLHGHKKRLSYDGAAGTLFENNCSTIDEIELVRNLIIHNGLLDDLPKAYVERNNGVVVNKFILMPDRNGPQWARHVNRCLFYGSEDRINLRLPDLLADFQQRQLATLDIIQRKLASRPPPGP